MYDKITMWKQRLGKSGTWRRICRRTAGAASKTVEWPPHPTSPGWGEMGGDPSSGQSHAPPPAAPVLSLRAHLAAEAQVGKPELFGG